MRSISYHYGRAEDMVNARRDQASMAPRGTLTHSELKRDLEMLQFTIALKKEKRALDAVMMPPPQSKRGRSRSPHARMSATPHGESHGQERSGSRRRKERGTSRRRVAKETDLSDSGKESEVIEVASDVESGSLASDSGGEAVRVQWRRMRRTDRTWVDSESPKESARMGAFPKSGQLGVSAVAKSTVLGAIPKGAPLKRRQPTSSSECYAYCPHCPTGVCGDPGESGGRLHRCSECYECFTFPADVIQDPVAVIAQRWISLAPRNPSENRSR
jgi:hypothetical protein